MRVISVAAMIGALRGTHIARSWVVAISAVFVASALGYGVLRSEIGHAQTSGPSFTKSVEVDRGTYFRLKVKLTYKGEPQDFDIVVGCNVKQINYKDGSRTLEVGLIPSVFGRRMSDGKGLVVRPPRACRGETTANGLVDSDLLPVIVVYDDAETLAFGAAYLSEDAYESPLSVLTFGGAIIESASAADFEEFRRAQPNLVKPASYHTLGSLLFRELNLAPAAVPMGKGCYGYARFRLIGDELEHVRAIWPADRPQYWRPTRPEDLRALNSTVRTRPMQTDHDGAPLHPRSRLMIGLDNEAANRGMPTRRGAGRIRFAPAAPLTPHRSAERIRSQREEGPLPPSYYPDIGPWIALPWPSDPPGRAEVLLREGPRVGTSIDFRGGKTRGFAYCRPNPANFPTGRTDADYPDPSKRPSYRYLRMPAADQVDEVEVLQVPPQPYRDGYDGPYLIVERDEFIFLRFVIGLGSTRGDV